MNKFILISFLLISHSILSQVNPHIITGTISDKKTAETLIGANILVNNNKINGTASDINGNFTIKVLKLPITLTVTYMGYQSVIIEVKNSTPLKIQLQPTSNNLAEIRITDTRITKKQKQAPLTVEALDMRAIKETPSVNFYDGLGALKGVDITSASLGFKVINTRGFNSTSPVRSLQIIDGVDNQSPGLNFSLGNFLGVSELDIMMVEVIQGASSAYYGPNAFNGVINMITRDPFLDPGISVQYKFGNRNLFETAIRIADKKKNKMGKDILAYKINVHYMQAKDWEANNMSAVDGTTISDNPGGYDAVNRYGDEDTDGNLNDLTGDFNQFYFERPGLGKFHRSGYLEKNLVDYNTNNFKIQSSIHCKLRPQINLTYSLNYSTGTTVYQGDNRFSLKNIEFWQNRIELVKNERYFLRAYRTKEDAGNSYDAVATAFKLQEYNFIANQDWYSSYKSNWSLEWEDMGWSTPNLVFNPLTFQSQWIFNGEVIDINNWINSSDSVLNANKELIISNHRNTREYTDYLTNRLIPGTQTFEQVLNDITSKISYLEGGTGFYDKSALNHIHGEYQFNPSFGNIKIGVNYRLYQPNSKGSLFVDTANRITNSEYGIYKGIETKLLNQKLIFNTTIRVDKNENFNFNISPASSIVFSPSKRNIYRASFSSAIRNPTLADQYLYYDVGRAILIGNLNGHGMKYGENLVTIESLVNFYLPATTSIDSLVFFSVDPIQPEKAKTFEFGYRGTLANKLYVDMNYYYSIYNNFIGYKVGAKFDTIGNDNSNAYEISLQSIQAYRMAANAENNVTTKGASIGINFYINPKLTITGNYSWNKLKKSDTNDPIIPAYNTPEHKYNIGISGSKLNLGNHHFLEEFSFNLNYRWIDEFLFEGSPQFTGVVPSYDILDIQISKKLTKLNAILKVGSSNILNNIHYEVYGGPYIGRMSYCSILFDIK